MTTFYNHLSSLPLDRVLTFLDQMRARIPLLGGRHFIHSDYPRSRLCINQILTILQGKCQANSEIGQIVMKRIHSLDSAADASVRQSWFFTRMLTCVRRFFGNRSFTPSLRSQLYNGFLQKPEHSSCFICYQASEIQWPAKFSRGPHTTEVIVVNQDTLAALRQENLNSRCLRPVLLDMANSVLPGGHYKNPELGSSQEEFLVERSMNRSYQLGATLEFAKRVRTTKATEAFIPDDGCLYLPTIHYYLNPLTDAIANCATICAAAPDFTGIATPPSYENTNYRTTMKNIIRSIFHAAAVHDHDTLILGALGCGMFNNRPSAISRMFKEVLEQEFGGIFRKVIFAIKGGDPDVLTTFTETFKHTT